MSGDGDSLRGGESNQSVQKLADFFVSFERELHGAEHSSPYQKLSKDELSEASSDPKLSQEERESAYFLKYNLATIRNLNGKDDDNELDERDIDNLKDAVKKNSDWADRDREEERQAFIANSDKLQRSSANAFSAVGAIGLGLLGIEGGPLGVAGLGAVGFVLGRGIGGLGGKLYAMNTPNSEFPNYYKPRFDSLLSRLR